MIVGDPSKWTARFRSVDNRLLERIVVVWPKCLKVLSGQPTEDIITINLVYHLLNDEKVRSIVHWIEYQFEPFRFRTDGSGFSTGQVDMGVLLSQDRQVYLAYECKRLNVTYNGSKQSLATVYVSEGLMRFITEQYAETLPVGCMLGYVMDGDSVAAIAAVQAAITANQAVQVNGTPKMLAAVQNMERFSTTHLKQKTNSEIEIRHAFLPF